MAEGESGILGGGASALALQPIEVERKSVIFLRMGDMSMPKGATSSLPPPRNSPRLQDEWLVREMEEKTFSLIKKVAIKHMEYGRGKLYSLFGGCQWTGVGF